MTLFVLDTDHVTLFQRTHPRVVQRIRATPPESLAVTVVTVEEHAGMGGFGSAVLEALADAGLTVPVHCLGIPDRLVEHGDPDQQRAQMGLDREGIARAAREVAGRRTKS